MYDRLTGYHDRLEHLLSLHKSRLPALACAVVFLLCELLSRPWAATAICDDWSYIRSAQLLAQTGHIHYVGWSAAILGWQLYLGAAFFKLFGFSFTAARITTLLVGMATAFLAQRTLVRLGLTSRNATLGALTLVLSPLFMMLSATFLTDVPGFFAVLVCLYGCLRALQSTSDRAAALWLAFAVASNLLCGTSRQPAWLGTLVLVPCTLWLLRSRRRVFFAGLCATALGGALVFSAMRWFARRPYAQVDSFPLHLNPATTFAVLFTAYGRGLLEVVLLLLPVAALYLLETPRWPRRILLPLSVLVAVALGLYARHPHTDWNALLNPFMGDWVGLHGNFEGLALVGQPPIIIGHFTHILLGVLTLGSLLAIAVTLCIQRPALQPAATNAGRLPWPHLLFLLLLYSAAHAILLIHRAEFSIIYDRYLLPLLFVLLCCLLRYYQDFLRQRLPSITVPLLAVLAIYGVSYTHNLFALGRARAALAHEALAAGVPDTALDLGWEQDGWTELQHSAYINGPSIVTPPGAYQPIPDPHRPGCHERLPQFGLYPHLAPQFGVSFDPNACDGPAPFAPVTYSTWPLRRPTTLYLVRYPPPYRPESDFASPLK